MTTNAFDQLSAEALKHNAHLLKDIQRGIEKEGLRVDRAAMIAQTPHRPCLGSALTHPHITTDYSEALLELITQPHNDHQAALDELLNTHRWVYQCIDDEVIWPGSMPCKLQGENSIPIAEYGNSNNGIMKHIYRQGLAWRYGRIMQSIAGIHYNFSLPDAWWQALYEQSDKAQSLQDFTSAGYMALIRNFRRHAWLLTYLFGASPALDASFFDGKPHQLERLDVDTLYLPHATCLRMTDLGYKSVAQEQIKICYNQLDSYINTLGDALHIKYPDYETIGIKGENKEYRQLNTNLLQIENEFYSEVRPKNPPKRGEKPLEALSARGIQYIEIRLLDINPYLPLGLDKTQNQFLDAFLLHCLLTPSPECDDVECQQIKQNMFDTAQRGRDTELQLHVCGKTDTLIAHAKQHLTALQNTTTLLDAIHGGNEYQQSLMAQQAKLDDINLLPSQQLMNDMQQDNIGYADKLLALAKQHQSTLKQPLINNQTDYFKTLTKQSHEQQRDLEANSQKSFDEFLADYFNN